MAAIRVVAYLWKDTRRSVVEESPYRLLTLKKAKETRTLVIWPDNES
jgi:hypothetical protein